MRYIYNIVPQTLLSRFLLIIIIPTILAQMIAVYLFYDRHWYNVVHYTSDLIANEMALLANKISNDDTAAAHALERYLNVHYIFYPNEKFSHIESTNIEELEILKEALQQKLHTTINVFLSPDENHIVTEFPLKTGIIRAQFQAKALINPTTDIFVLWILSLTIILLVVSIIFSKNQIRSILSLAHAADQFGRGIKDDKFKPSGAQEIRIAGMAFIRMKDRLEKQITKRTQMLAMISHDLRTPITRIKLQLELMDDKDELKDIASDVESMEHMISSYLDFARGEGGEDTQTVQLCKWIKDNLDAITPQNLQIHFGIFNNKLLTDIKVQAFKRALMNILNNAARYGRTAIISIYKSDTKDIVLDIEDDGSGISDHEKKLVFKPFYRSDKARKIDEHNGNVGLGLAITKEIISGHGGTISMHNGEKLGGLLVRITLPNARD